MPEQWISTLQLLHEDLWEELMGQVSRPTSGMHVEGGDKKERQYKRKRRVLKEGIEKERENYCSIKN